MKNICRFCLTVSDQGMCKLQDSDILRKIRACLTIHILTEELLPNQICNKCVIKIKEMHEFCSTVKQNEQKLRQYLNEGCLQDYIIKLNNEIVIKEEDKETILFCDSKCLNNADCNINGVTEIDIVTKIKDNFNTNTTKIVETKESFKVDESSDDNFETAFSSDDETLSSIKKDKENCSYTSKESKTMENNKSTRKKIGKNQESNPNLDKFDQFTCLTCLELCNTQTELIKHYRLKHLNKNKKATDLKYLENESDGQITYKCSSCDKECRTKKEITRHLAVHDDDRPLICKLCGRMYKQLSDILRHARVHYGFKLQCSYQCGYTTAYQSALKEHENRHLRKYKYTCDKCGKGFSVRTWYEQHQNVHSGLKPFVCEICGLAFHMDRYLTAHRSWMHPQSSSVKRYICVHCNHKCDSANSLALHLEKHGKNKGKDFLCDFCGKVVSSAEQLKYHHRMHSGVKPYSCSICNKSFAKKFNVKIHMSSHSGEKTHACARCGKRYTQRSTLLRHVKRHHAGASPTRTG